MIAVKNAYTWKGLGLLLLIGAVAAVLILAPALRGPPQPGPAIDLPAMTNIPPEGSLHIDTRASESE